MSRIPPELLNEVVKRLGVFDSEEREGCRERVFTPSRLVSKAFRQFVDEAHPGLFNAMVMNCFRDLSSDYDEEDPDDHPEMPDAIRWWLPLVTKWQLYDWGDWHESGDHNTESRERFLGDFLSSLHNLQELTIYKCDLHWLPSLSHCRKITNFHLEQTYLCNSEKDGYPSHTAQLASMLSELSELETLTIRFVEMFSTAPDHAQAVKDLCLEDHNLAKLSLRECFIRSAGMEALRMDKNDSIVDLNLVECELDDEALDLLARQLESNSTLQKLDLKRNQASRAATERFRDAYKACPTRKWLAVDHFGTWQAQEE